MEYHARREKEKAEAPDNGTKHASNAQLSLRLRTKMTLTPSDVGSLSRSLSRWELGEYICAAFVTIACAGEYIADFKDWFTGGIKERKDRLAKRSTLLLIVALSLELICLVRTNAVSGMIIGSLERRAEEAERKADEAVAKSGTAVSQAQEALNKAGSAEAFLGKAEGEASKAQTAASSALTLARGARQEADSFEREIVSAKRRTAEIETLMAPRRVSSEQAKQLCSVIRVTGRPTLELASSFGTTEADDFAEDIGRALAACGFAVTHAKSVLIYPVPKPMRIAFAPGRERDADSIASAMFKAKIVANPIEQVPVSDAKEHPDALRLLVGPKSE